MELIQDRHRRRMNENWRQREVDQVPVVKLFYPAGAATWLLTGIDPEDQDYAFGLCDLGMQSPELGHVLLSELTQPVKGVSVERDIFFQAEATLTVYWQLARMEGGIVTSDSEKLRAAYVALTKEARDNCAEPFGRLLSEAEITEHYQLFGGA